MPSTRRAGLNERRCIARDINRLYGSIVVIGQYTASHEITVDQWRTLLLTALQNCVTKETALRTVVKDSASNKPLLSTLDHVDAEAHLTFLEPTVHGHTRLAATLLDAAHALPLDDYEERPQWRALAVATQSGTTLTSFYLAFACSHVLLDGMSCTIFHKNIIDALTGVEISDAVKITTLAPALDQAVKLPISWSFLLKPLLQELLPTSVARVLGVKNNTEAWIGGSCPSLVANQLLPTNVQVLSMDAATLLALLEVCRSYRTKLTALINLLTAQSLALALSKRGRHHRHFITETPYDLRRLIAGSTGVMANYVSASEQTMAVDTRHTHKLSPEEWKGVRDATTVLQERSSTLWDQPVALLSYLSNINAWVKKRAVSPRQSSFSASNLGSFTYKPPESAWRIVEMVFSQSADATGAPLNVNVASCAGGSLNVVFSWWPGILGVDDEVQFVQEVSEGLLDRLRALI